MTYADLIKNLSNEIRDQRAWPSNGASDKVKDQLLLIFGALLVITREIDLGVLRHSAGVVYGSEKENLFEDLTTIPLPPDRFFIRPDHGITGVLLSTDGYEYSRFNIIESQSIETLRSSVKNPFQQGNPLFRIDLLSSSFSVAGAEACKIEYVAMFEEPTSSNYEELNFPLPKPYDRQVIQLVSMEVEAIKTGNANKSAIHKALADFYGDNI